MIGLPGVHIECKRVEHLNLSETMKQAVRDAGAVEVPAVFHRKNREMWLVTMRLDERIKMYAESRREN